MNGLDLDESLRQCLLEDLDAEGPQRCERKHARDVDDEHKVLRGLKLLLRIIMMG